MRNHKRLIGFVMTSAVLVVVGLAAIPIASADTCVVTVTTVTGQKMSFTVNVPPGTPLSSISLPVKTGIANVSESCSSPPPPPSGSSSNGSSSGSGSGSGSGSSGGKTTSTGSSPPPRTTKSGSPQPSSHHGSGGGGGSHSGHGGGGGSSTGTTGTGSTKTTTTSKPPPPVSKNGVPNPTNPTFSFALPGPAPLGVPNFFIDNFRIPPFLLPIYQAAGIEYDVPWQVLAGINEIESDYGRNLSTSSAGAVGWMQFLPSTWKTWGVDANGDGVADPYNPVDAIFSAARYLHAAGASKNLGQAIFSYNHAWWYVQSVELRAKLIGGMPDGLIGALTGLVQGHFPVAAKARYAD